MEYEFKNKFWQTQQEHGGESKWRMALKQEKIIEENIIHTIQLYSKCYYYIILIVKAQEKYSKHPEKYMKLSSV